MKGEALTKQHSIAAFPSLRLEIFTANTEVRSSTSSETDQTLCFYPMHEKMMVTYELSHTGA